MVVLVMGPLWLLPKWRRDRHGPVDDLTGLPSRQEVKRRFDRLRDQREVLTIFADIDGLKAINDTYGHDAGDELLKFAAKAFTSTVRNQDAVARLGGDEFAVLTSGDWTQARAQALADQLEASLAEPVVLADATVKVGVAVGIALPETPDEPSADVVKRADQAMYARKAAIKGIAKPSQAA